MLILTGAECLLGQMFRSARQMLLPLALMALSPGALALNTNQMTPQERAVLPEFCEFTQTFVQSDSAGRRYQAYVRRFGKPWTSVHHYCWAIAAMLRYNSPNIQAQERQSLAQSAIGDIDYVLERSDPSFVLWYQIVSRKGRILILQKKFSEAEELAKSLIATFPKRADSYGLLAEVYYSSNRNNQARSVIERAKKEVDDLDRLRQFEVIYR